MSAALRPFRFAVPDEAVTDLHARIDRTRWPDEVNDAQWGYGVRGDYLKSLVHHWRDRFDWRAAERRINALPQYVTGLGGTDIHFVHCRSPHEAATPLILTHGWPGSIVEFLDVIPWLVDPERFGGRAEDAFHVVAPSLQGYGGSPPAAAAGMSPLCIARRHVELMARLGYGRYVAQGGDWGSLVAHHTATLDPAHCAGLHLNLLTPQPPKDVADPMDLVQDHEKAWLAAVARHVELGAGYYQIHRTRPQTLAYALTDSPVGWCAWVTEKFHGWTDCERDGVRDPRNAVSWDAMLTNISLYWFTGTIASSIRLYREQALAEARRDEVPGSVTVPTGIAVYPAEIFRCPRAWAERRYPIVHWYEAPRGGHFAAMEQPQIFAEDLRAFRAALPSLRR
ncbi:MAG: epoxide hydrolase family protein [Steroidobacteraceae bacterium]